MLDLWLTAFGAAACFALAAHALFTRRRGWAIWFALLAMAGSALTALNFAAL